MASAVLGGLSLLIAGCAAVRPESGRQPAETEAFGSTTTHSREFETPPAATCEAARRALLSQGFTISTATGDRVNGRKNFQPKPETHLEIEFNVVCASEGRGGRQTIAFVTALQDRYALKKSNNSASLGVPVLGSLSLPITGSDDAMVKVASETVSSAPFYDKFFLLLDRYLEEALDTGDTAIEPVAAASSPVGAVAVPTGATGAPTGATGAPTAAVSAPSAATAPVSVLAPVTPPAAPNSTPSPATPVASAAAATASAPVGVAMSASIAASAATPVTVAAPAGMPASAATVPAPQTPASAASSPPIMALRSPAKPLQSPAPSASAPVAVQDPKAPSLAAASAASAASASAVSAAIAASGPER